MKVREISASYTISLLEEPYPNPLLKKEREKQSPVLLKEGI